MINIPSNRINLKAPAKPREHIRPQAKAAAILADRPRAHVNFIPSPESLKTMITGAVDALKRGVRWDRGSILNLLV